MSADLDSLIVDLRGLDAAGIESTGRDLFREIYLPNGEPGVLKTHDGEDVYFWEDSFDHAFFNVTEWQTSSTKDAIDRTRVARIKWIKEFIAGNVINSECWTLPVSQNAVKRIYFSKGRGHLIWLVPRTEGGLRFKSAYSADGRQLVRYTKQKGAKLVCKF